MENCIEIKNLTQVYKRRQSKFVALDNINLAMGKGMFGLLGPNGAGKTTMMRILATLQMPTKGEISIYGRDLFKNRKYIRKILGYLPQEFGVYSNLNAEEFLDYIARLNGIRDRKKRTEEVKRILALTNLEDVKDRRIKTFSGGMVRRLGIAQALIGAPQLLIVDEPTTGLDPEERIRFRNLLMEISGDISIILSTHIVNDISSTCNDLAILNNGQLVYHGSPIAFIEKARDKTWVVKTTEEELDNLKEDISIISMIVQRDHLQVRIVADEINGIPAKPVEPNLEDAYIYFMEVLTGVKLHEDEQVFNA